jgi:hypothetical protein
MIVLKATLIQYKELNGYLNNTSKLQFIKDADGNWIVGKGVLSDPIFSEIHDKLKMLKQIEYKPITELE